jgi:myo-inositol-1(or 4)-monophosphatase
VEEAGGTVSGFYGQPLAITDRDVVASNGVIQAELIHEFAEIFSGRGLEPLPDPREYKR